MKIFLFIAFFLFLGYSCSPFFYPSPSNIPTNSSARTFYKVTNRPLSRYFKNPADSALLGNIVPTGLLTHDRFANRSVRKFLKKIGLCNDNLSAQVYIPCDPHFIAIMPLNDKKPSKDTLIGYSNHLQELYGPPYEEDGYIFTDTYISKKYSNTILVGIIGYYIDEIYNKILVTHSEKFYFPRTADRNTEYMDSALVLYKWKNQRYIPDSILTIKGNLIPKAEYEEKYRYRVHTLQ